MPPNTATGAKQTHLACNSRPSSVMGSFSLECEVNALSLLGLEDEEYLFRNPWLFVGCIAPKRVRLAHGEMQAFWYPIEGIMRDAVMEYASSYKNVCASAKARREVSRKATTMMNKYNLEHESTA